MIPSTDMEENILFIINNNKKPGDKLIFWKIFKINDYLKCEIFMGKYIKFN